MFRNSIQNKVHLLHKMQKTDILFKYFRSKSLNARKFSLLKVWFKIVDTKKRH